MMTSRELVNSALDFREVPRIPLDNQHPASIGAPHSDVAPPPYSYGNGRSSGTAFRKGCYTDAWGCIWEAGEDNVTGEVKDAPLHGESWDSLRQFSPPYDVLENADLTQVDPFCASTTKFVIPMWTASCNLFERMQYLRGTEQLMLDIAYQEDGFFQLRDMVHRYFLKQLQMWVRTKVDAIHINDDWGSQRSLLISPEQWRTLFKPLYAEYCRIAREHGKRVIMHSDGVIESILDDLSEIGVNAINSQLFCMNVESLAQRFHHRLAFWGEIDRQNILPFGTEQQCRDAVRRVAAAFLQYGRTGVIGQCFSGSADKPENIRAVYEEWAGI